MASIPRMTTPVVRVMSAMLASPETERYGLELMHDTGLASGTLYPVLVRLEHAGWVVSAWESIDPVAGGRPPRRYYRLTGEGAAAVRQELAVLHQQMSRAAGLFGQVAEA